MPRPNPSPARSVRVVGAALVFVGALLPWLRVTSGGGSALVQHTGLHAGFHYRALVLIPLVVTALVFVVHRPSESRSRIVGSAAGIGSVLLVGFYWVENVGSSLGAGPGMVVTIVGGALLVLATTRPELISRTRNRLLRSG